MAATAERLLLVRPLACRRAADLLKLPPPKAVQLVALLAACHDLGKFAPAFQAKAEGPPWPFERPRDVNHARSEHDRDGLLLWRNILAREYAPRVWAAASSALTLWIGAATGHHGRAVAAGFESADERFERVGVDAARLVIRELIAQFLPEPIEAPRPPASAAAAFSFWLAGFTTLADWVGSNQRHFPFDDPTLAFTDYCARARVRAREAVDALGVAASAAAPSRPAAEITGQRSLTPLQALAAELELGAGPTLVVVEDVTGAGKTEAAQILVHRLMARGDADGAFWALPTQATANAMYRRQERALAALFGPDERPQLVLAHGGARHHARFRQSILRESWVARADSATSASAETHSDGEPVSPAARVAVRGAADEPATLACAAFIADDARLALLADVGAGTIDQAILGVLPARFQSLRLFGLSSKVLVVDEAHAYDAYVSEELCTLLGFHAALGGSAIVLSATLPRNLERRAGREQIVRAWLEGAGAARRELGAEPFARSAHYPLVTVVDAPRRVRELPVDAASWSRRTVPVRFVHDDAGIVAALVAAARDGAAVGWVRNAVDDALEAAAAVRAAGLEPVVFHARFAQCDRQTIERRILERLGRESTPEQRRGLVVIATQVIEQSLDIDFDLLATDLAPIDLIVQRAGRLWRHPERDRPPVKFQLLVRTPAYADEPSAEWLVSSLRRTSFVYPDPALLWRTHRVLRNRGAIVTPDALRELVEAAYDSEAPVPEGLRAAATRAEGAALAEGSHARYAVLSLRDGYSGEQMQWLDEDRLPVRTRLGEAQTVVRLARLAPDGSVQPWAPGDLGSRLQRWSLSEVKVAARRVPPGCACPPRLRAAADQARAEWGTRERERPDVVLLALEPAGARWSGSLIDPQGRHRECVYSDAYGLGFA